MHGESVETRLARLEEAMVSVKGDTVYIRRGFDSFKNAYWEELVKSTSKVAGVSAITSFVVGVLTIAIAHAVWR